MNSPLETLLQRLLHNSDDDVITNDLLESVVSTLSQPDATLPYPPQEILLPICQHTRSLSAANQGTSPSSIGLLLHVATQLLLHHCPTLQQPAAPSSSTGPVVEVLEATPLDELPHHLIAVAAATAPHPALDPDTCSTAAAAFVDAMVNTHASQALPAMLLAHAAPTAALLRPWLATPPRADDVLVEEREVPMGKRCVAARSVAWLVCHSLTTMHNTTADHGLAYTHLLLLVLKDASPTVRAPGAAALRWLAAQGPQGPQCLAPRLRRALLDACCSAVQGTDPPLWEAMAVAACAYAVTLHGMGDDGALTATIDAMLTIGALRAHRVTCSTHWLRATRPLLDALGLQLVAYFRRLMPLLLGWLRVSSDDLQQQALESLGVVVRATQPRMPAHAAVVARAVEGCRDQPACGAGVAQAADDVLAMLAGCR